jgi:hypothetical protein
MKTFRNLAFLVLLAGMLAFGQEDVLALTPPDFDCPSGCECEPAIDYGSWSGFCENEAGADGVCDDIDWACSSYCEGEYEDWLHEEFPGYSYWCWLETPIPSEGCWPYGLEPPTSFECSCFCWVT